MIIRRRSTTQSVGHSKTVTETIHYRYSDGTTAAPDKVQTLTFTQTGQKDLVTGEISWGEWTPAQSFAEVDSPVISGYTADHQEIDPQEVNKDSADLTFVVTYTKSADTSSQTNVPGNQPGQPGSGQIGTPNASGTPGTPSIPGAPATVPEQSAAKQLPQNGSVDHSGLIALGLSGMIAMMGLAGKHRKEN